MKKETLSTSETPKAEVPKHINALEEKYKEIKKNAPEEKEPLNPDNIGDELIKELPEPSGWRILVLKPRGPRQWWSGSYSARQSAHDRDLYASCLKWVGRQCSYGSLS